LSWKYLKLKKACWKPLPHDPRHAKIAKLSRTIPGADRPVPASQGVAHAFKRLPVNWQAIDIIILWSADPAQFVINALQRFLQSLSMKKAQMDVGWMKSS
jgi:transcription antitermination factor NusA-like protein